MSVHLELLDLIFILEQFLHFMMSALEDLSLPKHCCAHFNIVGVAVLETTTTDAPASTSTAATTTTAATATTAATSSLIIAQRLTTRTDNDRKDFKVRKIHIFAANLQNTKHFDTIGFE